MEFFILKILIVVVFFCKGLFVNFCFHFLSFLLIAHCSYVFLWIGDGAPNAPVDNKDAVLGDEDLVTVSYMAEELDLETVGDIIAIIEEKVTLKLKYNSQLIYNKYNKLFI